MLSRCSTRDEQRRLEHTNIFVLICNTKYKDDCHTKTTVLNNCKLDTCTPDTGVLIQKIEVSIFVHFVQMTTEHIQIPPTELKIS